MRSKRNITHSRKNLVPFGNTHHQSHERREVMSSSHQAGDIVGKLCKLQLLHVTDIFGKRMRLRYCFFFVVEFRKMPNSET